MFMLVFSVLMILAGIAVPLALRSRIQRIPRLVAGFIMFAVGMIAMIETSIVKVPADMVGVVRKVYGATSLPQGRLIATAGETGYQAEVIPPGAFRVSMFFNVFNDVTLVPVVVVPQGFYGRVVTRDGAGLLDGEVMAPVWPEPDIGRFLDPSHFLATGGRRGLQATILLPGSYPINLALYSIRIGYQANGRDVTTARDDIYDMEGLRHETTPLVTSITSIPAGFVGVVRSTITEIGADCRETSASTTGDGLVARLVPHGCRGIWSSSLNPGDYYLNRDAYDVTLVDTRVQTLEFRGGFLRRVIDLKVDQKGDFVQSERSDARPFDEKLSADTAVNTKVEGWEVPQELRAIIQIQPQHAPIVVAAVGGLAEIERRIMIPAIRSRVRNVFGGSFKVEAEAGTGTVVRPTRILDLIEHRSDLEAAIATLVAQDGNRAGVDVKEIRLGESVIPPELLLARQREQLAEQLKKAYQQEQIAQTQRQSSEQARATADQQNTLVSEQIAVQKAELAEKRRSAEGRGERVFLEQQAAGQTAQANVLGKDNVLKLQELKMTLDLLDKHPDLLGHLTLPRTLVLGGNGLESALATLGASVGDALHGADVK